MMFSFRHVFISGIISMLIPNVNAQPQANFNISRLKVCSGSTVLFTNTSMNANQYAWLLDNSPFSTATDTSLILVEPCYDLKEVKLIACDTTLSVCDTARAYVEVFDTCFFHWTSDRLNCPGDTVVHNAHPEAMTIFWNVQPLHNFITGCDTCASVSFVIQHNSVNVDAHFTYQGGCSEITSTHYMCFTGIEEPESNFTIYPNPFVDWIRIDNNSEKLLERLRVYNFSGALLLTFDGFTDEIDLSSLTPGLYFIEITFHGMKHAREYRLITKQ